jgi:ribose transport system permease protein
MGKNKLKETTFDFNKLLAPVALVAIYVFFVFAGNNFFTMRAFITILEASYFIAFLAMGVTFAIITGGIDLSIGAVMMCAALVGGVAYNSWGFSIWASLFICLLTGSTFGLINGILIAKFKLVPFVATLGIQMVASGFGAIVSQVVTQRFPTVGTEDGVFKYVFYSWYNIPTGLLWLIFFFFIAYILLNKSRLGRYTYAMGSNEEAARLSGVNVDKWKILVYVLGGFFAGMAGIMFAAAYTSIVPATGAGMEILGIAAVVIGGTSLAGGSGTLTGTIIGVYIMAVLRQGLMSMGLQGHFQLFFTGIVVIAAVMLDIYRNKRASQVRKRI